MPRGDRQPAIAPGIYPDAKGFEVVARAAGRTKATRFPAGTKLSVMLAWQDEKRSELRKSKADRDRVLRKGTLAGDVAAYLAGLTDYQRKQRLAPCSAWLTPTLRDRPRSKITLADLRIVVNGWEAEGVAANTINHRRRALTAVYESIDGDEVKALPRRLKRRRQPAAEPRAVDMAVLDAIIDGMPDRPYALDRRAPNRAKARLRFLLWTACTPEQMRKMGPHSVDLERKELTKPGREKGRGAPAVTLPLVEPHGVHAARGWLRAQAWGSFRTPALAKRFDAAVRRYRDREAAAGRVAAVPPDIRLYDLRHSFLTWLAHQTITPATPSGNPLVVQHYAQHKSLETTKRYMLAAIAGMVRAALVAPDRGTRAP